MHWLSTKWIPQIAALFTIIGIPYAFLKLVIYKAKHKIYFDPRKTYFEVKLVDHVGQPQSIWLHFMVRNKGYEVSKNTEAYLSGVWRLENQKYQKLNEFKAPVKLKWAHEESIIPINILPKENRRLDVCYICQNERVLYLMARGFPSGSIKNMLEPNNYLFVINVVSENNLRPARFIFKVDWDGEWGTLRGDKYIKSFRIRRGPIKSFSIY